MSKVMSDLMALFNHIINTFIIAMEFLQCKENNCALMFIMSNHYGRKYIAIRYVSCVSCDV